MYMYVYFYRQIHYSSSTLRGLLQVTKAVVTTYVHESPVQTHLLSSPRLPRFFFPYHTDNGGGDPEMLKSQAQVPVREE